MRQSLGTPNLYYIVYGRPLLFAKSHSYDARKNVRLLKDNIRITDAARKNIRVLMDNIRKLQKYICSCKMIYICSFFWHCKKIYGCCQKTCGCCKEKNWAGARKYVDAAWKNIELRQDNIQMRQEKDRRVVQDNIRALISARKNIWLLQNNIRVLQDDILLLQILYRCCKKKYVGAARKNIQLHQDYILML